MSDEPEVLWESEGDLRPRVRIISDDGVMRLQGSYDAACRRWRAHRPLNTNTKWAPMEAFTDIRARAVAAEEEAKSWRRTAEKCKEEAVAAASRAERLMGMIESARDLGDGRLEFKIGDLLLVRSAGYWWFVLNTGEHPPSDDFTSARAALEAFDAMQNEGQAKARAGGANGG